MISTAEQERVNTLNRTIASEELLHEVRMDSLYGEIEKILNRHKKLSDKEFFEIMGDWKNAS